MAHRQHKQTQRRMESILLLDLNHPLTFRMQRIICTLLEELNTWSKNYSERITKAIENNGQIKDSSGVPERVKALVENWERKGI